jgi:demethylmenaquinone methyltransferase / 2-methoxy-6-polyprenyl-1,4-benzoquinol methylase
VSSTLDAARPLPVGDDKRRAVESMFDRIAPGYARMNRLISLGQDARWRRRAVALLELPTGSTVLDVGCGTGDLCREIARVGLRAVGVDRSSGMLACASTDQPLLRADGEQLPVPNDGVDGLISAFTLRNVVDVDALLLEAARVVRRGGRVVALETATPAAPLLRVGHRLWTRGAVPLLGRVLAGDAPAYTYLPRSSAYLPTGDELLDRLDRAGFADARRETMTGGAVQLLVGTRR